jgi:hypothetical protein
MRIGTGEFQYEWNEHWVRVPDNDSGRTNGRTHGVAVTHTGDVVVFAQCNPGVLIFSADGKLKASWGDRFAGAHGLTLVHENGEDFLWLVDERSAEVVKTTLGGKTVQNITKPPHDAYEKGRYVPTWAAVNPRNGDVWITDGYGSSLVHRHTRDGKYVATLDGTEWPGRFNCPHGIAFHPTAAGAGELWIADRGNRRIAIYDGEGRYLRHRDAACHSPCMFSFSADAKQVLVPELFTGVKLLNAATLEVLADLGAGVEVGVADKLRSPKGWPNLAGTPHVQPGYFNSPHGACLAPNGDIYVGEWIVGGRVTRLAKR